jgi:NAD(P)-dependent dehydrogenase (short-subunit alcohol dehydrogenase family)
VARARLDELAIDAWDDVVDANLKGTFLVTRALAEEVRDEGLIVNAVCPGSVDTDMLRVGRPGAEADMSPEDVAGVVLYLAAQAPSALTGSCVDVFG